MPDDVDFIPVETADEMFDAVKHHLARMDTAVFAAAVADYRPARAAEQKMFDAGTSADRGG